MIAIDKKYVRVSELVKEIGCAKTTIYNAWHSGRIQAVKVGDSLFIDKTSLPNKKGARFFPSNGGRKEK